MEGAFLRFIVALCWTLIIGLIMGCFGVKIGYYLLCGCIGIMAVMSIGLLVHMTIDIFRHFE